MVCSGELKEVVELTISAWKTEGGFPSKDEGEGWTLEYNVSGQLEELI